MTIARTVAVLAAVALVAACASPKMVEIRPLGARSTAVAPASSRVAEGRAHLVLGDAGLALESFRRALAEDPQSVAALQGMAACYELMGRFDLSGRYYEQALANAPNDRETLGALASSLVAQGLDQQAAAVRNEMAPVAATSDVELPALVTLTLPPARPLEPAAEPPATRQAMVTGPRLERLSFGEVALITLPTTVPLARSAQRTAAVTALAARTARPALATVRLLNAARRQGLAAQTRSLLERQGWRGIVIGDAPRTRLASLVLFPAGHEVAARRLAARFGAPARQNDGESRAIIVLLGRNAAIGGRNASQRISAG
ncbi:MAG: LytR C-terminal domain-containing protein [Sphingomicrobium sp.]